MKGGPQSDRARTGSRHHLITETHLLPLQVSLTGGNRNDVTQLMPLVEMISPVQGRPGHPRRRPDVPYDDRSVCASIGDPKTKCYSPPDSPNLAGLQIC
jgi:hypothetical protein